MASTTRKPRQKMQTPAEVQADLVASVEPSESEKLIATEKALGIDMATTTPDEAPALTERKRRAAEAKAKREAEKNAVAERAAQVKAEQDAAPKPPKKNTSNAEAEARRAAQAERVAKVIELRKAGKKLGEIATELGYTSQQVVSSVLRRHAPDLQVQRVAGSGGLTLTPEQVTELRELETRFGAKLATITKALARADAS